MAGLSDILGNQRAEGADRAPSAPVRSCCDGSSAPCDPYASLPCFGFPEKRSQARKDDPQAQIDAYILFGSHADALGLFDLAKKEGFSVRISPTPRAARASCGVALLVEPDQVCAVCDLACAHSIAVENAVALPRQIKARRDRYC